MCTSEPPNAKDALDTTILPPSLASTHFPSISPCVLIKERSLTPSCVQPRVQAMVHIAKGKSTTYRPKLGAGGGHSGYQQDVAGPSKPETGVVDSGVPGAGSRKVSKPYGLRQTHPKLVSESFESKVIVAKQK
jgi:hypothetical protein